MTQKRALQVLVPSLAASRAISATQAHWPLRKRPKSRMYHGRDGSTQVVEPFGVALWPDLFLFYSLLFYFYFIPWPKIAPLARISGFFWPNLDLNADKRTAAVQKDSKIEQPDSFLLHSRCHGRVVLGQRFCAATTGGFAKCRYWGCRSKFTFKTNFWSIQWSG